MYGHQYSWPNFSLIEWVYKINTYKLLSVSAWEFNIVNNNMHGLAIATSLHVVENTGQVRCGLESTAAVRAYISKCLLYI